MTKRQGKIILLNAVVMMACFVAVFPVFIMISGIRHWRILSAC